MMVGLNIVGGQCYNFFLATHITGLLQKDFGSDRPAGYRAGACEGKDTKCGSFFCSESITVQQPSLKT